MKSFRTLYAIFFLSGATGLVYEVIWVRLTGLVFGNTSHAIAVVLGAFMAGLALGSWWLGRKADRTVSALRLYGLLEIGIGVSASLVPLAFRSLDSVYWALAPSLDPIPGANGFVRFITSFAILIVPTFLMGGTLPVLAKFFTQTVKEVQRKVGLLYALNTFGAAFGTLAAALFLIPGLGNMRSTLSIAVLNVIIGLLAIAMDRRWNVEMATDAPPDSAEAETRTSDETTDRLVLMTLAVSGFVSMLYEVAWTRALTAMIGSSTYAFSIMLVTFLVGIALGSSIAVKLRASVGVRLLGLVQLGIALGGVIFLVGYLVAPYLLLSAVRALYYSFPAVLTSQFILCSFLMILSTLCMGATLPIASQIYSNRAKLLGRSIGNIYSINTLGAIAGSLLAGFVLIPLAGTERTILAGLFFNSAMALLLLSAPSSKGKAFPRWVALALLVLATFSMRGGVFWKPEYLDQGILIYSKMFDMRPELTVDEHYSDTDVAYFKEGNNATISIRKGEDYVGLRTNGKVDASNKDDMMTQLMIGYLPFLFHPNPQSAMVIGYGGGVTVGATTVFPEVTDIDCLEIEPAVVGAGPSFGEYNRKSYQNPKVHIMYNDARNYMNVTRKQYDVIISEPSNPWIAGVASLFTSEFYERAAQVLKPDGVFAQWVQLYELDPEDLRMILFEFQQKFPEVSMWNSGGDLILIGTRQPQHLNLGRWGRLVEEDPSVARDLHQFLKSDAPEGLLAYYVMSSDQTRKFASTSNRRNTDDHPLLEFHAPRELFNETRDLNVELLYENKDGLIPFGAEIPSLQHAYSGLIQPLLAMGRVTYANQAMGMLATVPNLDPVATQLAIARIDIDEPNLEGARNALDRARTLLQPGGPLTAEYEELAGIFAEKVGDDELALTHFKAAIEAQPGRSQSLKKLAQMYGNQQAWDEAAVWMKRYVATTPGQLGQQWALLGDYYLAGKHADEAFAAFKTAMEIDPYTFLARYNMARLFEEKKQIPEAIEQYEFTIRYNFDREADMYIKLANLYRGAGKNADALRVVKKGLRLNPTNPALYRLYREVVAAD